jgi:hypothetical protein
MAFNWGSVDWGSVAQAGASLYASNQAAKAAQGAGNVAAQGSEAATALQREIYQDQRNLNMPFYQGGLQAYDQYRALMGLGGGSSGAVGGSQSQGGAQQSLVSHNAQGVPIANAQLYASNPAYKQAWDQVAQQHQGQWNTGYWNGSDPNWIESNLRGKLPVGWGSSPTGGAGQSTQTPQQAQQAAFAAFRNTPGYQFGLDEGQKQLQSSASASGGLFSGKAGKALTQYGQNYADQQGYTPYMNRLAGLFGGAQTAGSQMGAAGQNFANQAGANKQNAASSRASGLLGSSQAKMWGLGQAGGFLNDAYGYYQNGGGR